MPPRPVRSLMALSCPTCDRPFEEGIYCPFDGTRLQDPELDGRAGNDPLIGRVLDQRYLLEQRIGIGGMGAVYRARHVLMEKPVAVKVLRAELASDPYAAGRFRREARSASRIEHENCVAVTDFGQEPDGTHFLVMEYVEGQTLWQAIRQQGRLEPPALVEVAIQVARALNAAHLNGVVHRDLKPENVMLVRRGDRSCLVKVLDFGLAKVIQASEENAFTALTRHGMIFGTPRYMAPEQIEGREVDPRADLYSFGVMLYEMATGLLPFDDPSVVALLNKHVHEPPVPPSLRLPELELPLRLEQLILALMAKRPDQRPAHAREVLQQLEQLSAELLPRVPAAASVEAGAALAPTRRRRLAWLVPALLGGLAAALATGVVLRCPATSLPAGPRTGTPGTPGTPGDPGVASSRAPVAAPPTHPVPLTLRPGPAEPPGPGHGAAVPEPPAPLPSAVAVAPSTPAPPAPATSAARSTVGPPRPAAAPSSGPVRPAAPAPRTPATSSVAGASSSAVGRPGPVGVPATSSVAPSAGVATASALAAQQGSPSATPAAAATPPPTPPASPGPTPPGVPQAATAPAPRTSPTPISFPPPSLAGATTPASPPHAAPGESPVDGLLREARAALSRRDELSAAKALQQALAEAPGSPRVHLALANFHFERGNFAAAQKAAQRAVELHPGGIVELLLLGQAAYKRGDSNLACSSFREVLRLRPDQEKARHYMNLAHCP